MRLGGVEIHQNYYTMDPGLLLKAKPLQFGYATIISAMYSANIMSWMGWYEPRRKAPGQA
jgi:hypothetical protein